MRVAYFTESLPPRTDGVSHTISHLIKILEAHNIGFLFFSPFKPDSSIPWSNRVYKVVSMPFPLYRDYRVGLPMFENLRKELDSFKPDLIHIISPTLLGNFGLKYANKQNIAVVSSYHTDFVSYFRYYGVCRLEAIGWRILRQFYNQCLITYAPTSGVAEKLRTKGITNIELWPRGIDLKKFSPSFRSIELRRSIGAENIPILLFVGRLVKEKDLDDLVIANNLLCQWENRFKLVFVGDGPMKKELMAKLPEAYFTGYQYGETLSKWYASADIFVFPSTTEAFGNVIQEAFASGIPAVGVKKGGVADLILPNQNGMLAKPNLAYDFAKKIHILLNNKILRTKLGTKAKSIIAQNSWEAINQRLLNSYKNVLINFYCKQCLREKDPLEEQLAI
jgi:glycosyltransferase involved in cell wall biosynthesis